MWDMRRNLDPTPMPSRRCVIQFLYPELPIAKRHWWLIIRPGEKVDPGFDVDLYVVTDLRTMTAIWMGLANLSDEVRTGRVQVTGDAGLARSMTTWLGLSPFAAEKKRAVG